MAEKLREIPLIDVISNSGAVRDKYDKQKFQTSKGNISITGQKFINWSLGKGGERWGWFYRSCDASLSVRFLFCCDLAFK